MKMFYIFLITIFFSVFIFGGIYLYTHSPKLSSSLQHLFQDSESLSLLGSEISTGASLTEADNMIVNWEHTYAGLTSNEFVVTIKQKADQTQTRNITGEFILKELNYKADKSSINIYESKNISHPFEDYYECKHDIVNCTEWDKDRIKCLKSENISITGKDPSCGSFTNDNYYFDWVNYNSKSDSKTTTEARKELNIVELPKPSLTANENNIKQFKVIINSPLTNNANGWGSTGIFTLNLSGNEFYDKTNSSWFNTSWNYRKNITIQNVFMGSNLTDFPLYVFFNDSDIANHTLASGNDIRFAQWNGSDSIEIPFERENFTKVAGRATGYYWVKTNLTNTTATSTLIQIYYGNLTAGAGTDGQQIANTWDSNFKGVWHLPDGTNLGALDSIGDNNGTISGANATKGQVDGGGYYDVGDYVSTGTFSGTGNTTLSAWVYYDVLQEGSKILQKDSVNWGFWLQGYRDGPGGGWQLSADVVTTSPSTVGYSATKLYPLGTGFTGVWFYVVGVFDNNAKTLQLFVNGALNKTVATGSTLRTSGVGYVGNGLTQYSSTPHMTVDEARIAYAARSASWVNFEYNNIIQADNELTWSGEETQTAAPSDTEYPQFSNYQDNNASIFSGGIALFNVTVTSTNGTVLLNINGTSYPASNTTANLFNITLQGLLNNTYQYNWTAYGNGTSHLKNYSDSRYFQVNKSDTEYPIFSSLTETPSDPATYSQNAKYEFNATLLSTNGTVGIQFNGINYTASNSTGTPAVFNFTINDLAATVNYNYTWWAYGNGTNNLFNKTSTQTYTVNKASPTLISYLNGIYNNLTITFPQEINASGYTNFGIFKFYRNGIDKTSENGLNISLGAGNYYYLFNVTGNQNYSDIANVTLNLTINKASQTAVLTFNETSPKDYGYYLITICNGELWRDGVNITSLNGTAVKWGTNAQHNFSCQLYGNENYSYDDDNQTFVINKIIPQGSISGTSPITYGTAGDVAGTETNDGDADVTYGLFRNNVSVLNPDTTILGNATYQYIYNATAGQNYSENASIGKFILEVNKATTLTNLTFNLASPQIYPTAITPTCLVNVGTSVLNVNNTVITSGVPITLGASVWTFNCSIAATQNYTGYENISTFTITQNTTYAFNLAITPSQTETYPTPTTATGSNCPAELICNLTLNTTGIVANPHTLTLGVAKYNYTWNTTGNNNYSIKEISKLLTINQNITITSIMVSPASPITYPTASNFSCNNSAGQTTTLYINGVDKSAEKSLSIIREVNTYNLSCNFTGDTNYSGSSQGYSNYKINIGTGVVNGFINGTQSNFSVFNGTNNYNIWINLTNATGDGTGRIYLNGSLINNATMPLNNLTNFTLGVYNVTYKLDGNNNWTPSTAVWFVNISFDIISPVITIVYPQNTSYNVNVSNFNYTITDTGGSETLDTCWYSRDNALTNSTNIDAGLNFTNVNSLEGNEQNNTWKIWCNDSSGNEGNNTITFIVDRTPPEIYFGASTTANGYSNTNQTNVSVLSYNFSNHGNIWLTFNNTNISFDSNTTSQFDYITQAGWNLNNTFYSCANDSVGNLNCTETRGQFVYGNGTLSANITFLPFNKTVNAPFNLNFTINCSDNNCVDVNWSINIDTGGCILQSAINPFNVSSFAYNDSSPHGFRLTQVNSYKYTYACAFPGTYIFNITTQTLFSKSSSNKSIIILTAPGGGGSYGCDIRSEAKRVNSSSVSFVIAVLGSDGTPVIKSLISDCYLANGTGLPPLNIINLALGEYYALYNTTQAGFCYIKDTDGICGYNKAIWQGQTAAPSVSCEENTAVTKIGVIGARPYVQICKALVFRT